MGLMVHMMGTYASEFVLKSRSYLIALQVINIGWLNILKGMNKVGRT